MFDVEYSVSGNRVYRGDARFATQSDVLYTIIDGQFYKGDSTFVLDIVYTVRDGKVYRDRGEFVNSNFDVLYTIERGSY